MKQIIVNKFSENAGWRILFYLICVFGIVASLQVIDNPIRQYKGWIVIAMGVYVYMAIDLLWWFGDHPEE